MESKRRFRQENFLLAEINELHRTEPPNLPDSTSASVETLITVETRDHTVYVQGNSSTVMNKRGIPPLPQQPSPPPPQTTQRCLQ